MAQSSGPFAEARTRRLRQGRPTFFVSLLGPNLNLLLRCENYDAPNNLGQPCVLFGARKFSVSSVFIELRDKGAKIFTNRWIIFVVGLNGEFPWAVWSISIILSAIVLFFAYRCSDCARGMKNWYFDVVKLSGDEFDDFLFNSCFFHDFDQIWWYNWIRITNNIDIKRRSTCLNFLNKWSFSR